jgi:hypothetical protein
MKNREHHPLISLGLFLIVLGLALLVATNDLLNLGSISSYFTWQTALVFIGVLLLANLHFTGGIFMIALGTWFMLDEMFVEMPGWVEKMYWPGVIILVGLSFILSSLFGKIRKRSS